MPRPKQCRRICGYPKYWSFAPERLEAGETIVLMLDELETIRLIDLQGLRQEECAAAMGVSRATVAGIYEAARFKLADAMLNGKRISIAGGAYRMDAVPAAEKTSEKGENIMRIAVTYGQGTVGQHFGRTEQFKIYDIAEGRISDSQVVDTGGTAHEALAGFLRASGVEVLICGGIGAGAREALAEADIKIVPGVTGDADRAVTAYLAGELRSDPDFVCDHHGHGGDNCHHGGGDNCHHGGEDNRHHGGEDGCHHGGGHGCSR